MSELVDEIKDQMRRRFVTVALDTQAKQRHPTGPDSAKRLGYDPAEIDALPASVTESFAGVGNPLALGVPRSGETVLDLGCGAGVDSILAARQVGPSGRIVGVDAIEEMVAKARANAATVGVANAEFNQSEADCLPAGDGTIDRVISNGVFNLCFDKPAVLAEVYRILKPGGRLQMADVLLSDDVPECEVERKGAWSD
jgi:arsenite methyltransferase